MLILGGVLPGLVVGCRRSSKPKPTEPVGRSEGCALSPLDGMACEYVGLALALGERDPDSLDFSIAPADVAAAVHAEYPPLGEIAQRAAALRERLARLGLDNVNDRERARVLGVQLAAIGTRVEMLRGRAFPFDEEARRLFGTTRLPDAEVERRRQVKAMVAGLLPRGSTAGKSSAAARYAAYDRRFLVPGERLAEVMRAALKACREDTAEFVPLPAAEAVELAFVRRQPWSAFSRYRGQGRSTITVNLDLPLTVDAALELACHEGYPGHHVFNTLREQALVRERHWPEAEVQLTFSPQSYVSEAAAAFAPRLAMREEERVRVERDVLFPLAGLPPAEAARYVRLSALVRELDSAEPAIAREYLDGRLEFVRAEEAFADEVLMEHAEATLLYLNEYRSYMLAYTEGRRRVATEVGWPAGVREPEAAGSREERAQRWAAYVGIMREFRVSLGGP